MSGEMDERDVPNPIRSPVGPTSASPGAGSNEWKPIWLVRRLHRRLGETFTRRLCRSGNLFMQHTIAELMRIPFDWPKSMRSFVSRSRSKGRSELRFPNLTEIYESSPKSRQVIVCLTPEGTGWEPLTLQAPAGRHGAPTELCPFFWACEL